VQNLLSSRLLPKNLTIKIYRTIILSVLLYGCKTWSLTDLRRIFGPKRDEVKREWRKLQNEGLNELYSSPNVFRVIKSRRMGWAGHVARMTERRGVYGFWWGHLRERDHLGDQGVDGRIIVRWIFRKWDVGVCTGSSWLRIETGGGHL